MNSSTEARNSVSLPYLRWACLIALLTAEILTISLRFDAKGVHADRPWYGLVVHLGSVGRLGIAVGLATILVAGPRCYRELKREASRLDGSRWFFPAILGNLVAFLSFYWLSVPVLEGAGPSHPADWALVVAWGVTGLATLVLWGMAILPAGLWVVLICRSAGSLVAGPALGVAAYLVGLLAENQWQPLSGATLHLVRSLLSLVFSDTICQPDQSLVGTPSFQVAIAPECSGYEGMGLIAALLSIALWMFRRDFRFPRAFALLPMAMALMWLANAVRITSLVALGTWGYRELALGGFHSLAGWLLFLLIGLGLIACARRMPFFSTLPIETRCRSAVLDGAYLIPAMAVIATAMVTGTLSPGFDRYYPARVIAATIALVFYRQSYSELRLKWSWEAFVLGCGVFVLWMAMEPRGASHVRRHADPLRLGVPRSRLGCDLAILPGGRLGRHGTTGRGARLPRLPDPASDRVRFPVDPTGPIDVVVVPALFLALRGAARSLVCWDAGRDGLCVGVSPPRRADGRRPGPRRDQRADRDHGADDWVLVALGLMRFPARALADGHRSPGDCAENPLPVPLPLALELGDTLGQEGMDLPVFHARVPSETGGTEP